LIGPPSSFNAMKEENYRVEISIQSIVLALKLRL